MFDYRQAIYAEIQTMAPNGVIMEPGRYSLEIVVPLRCMDSTLRTELSRKGRRRLGINDKADNQLVSLPMWTIDFTKLDDSELLEFYTKFIRRFFQQR